MSAKSLPHPAKTSFDKRLTQYGAMSLAIVGAAAGSHAQAATVYWNGQNATEAVNGPGVEFNFFTGMVGRGAIAANGFFALNAGSSNMLFGPFVEGNINAGPAGKIFDAPASTAAALRFPSQRVGPFNPSQSQLATLGILFCSGENCTFDGNFRRGPTGYVGVEFTGPNGHLYYGWVNLTVNSNYSITLNEFAYNNTPNTPIVIQPVPEPSSMLLLTLGAAGIAAYRRKRAANAG